MRYLIEDKDVDLLYVLANARGAQGRGKARDCDVIQMRLREIVARIAREEES